MSITSLRNRSAARLSKAVASTKSPYENKDDRFWNPTQDKTGNAFAVIRFLPERDDESNPGFVKLYSHGFEGENGWYIENCLSTIGKEDPVQDYIKPLWKQAKAGDVEAEKVARAMGRKASYYANVLIVEDKANPESEGKVFIWRFGQKVFDKLKANFAPESEFETPRDPWDIFGDNGGANFRVKVRKVSGYNNYDLCAFDAESAISLNGKKLSDKEIEKVLDQRHALDSLIAADQFKSYDELKAKLDSVLGAPTRRKSAPSKVSRDEEEEKPSGKKVEKTPVSSDDDDDEAYLKNLLEEDDE